MNHVSRAGLGGEPLLCDCGNDSYLRLRQRGIGLLRSSPSLGYSTVAQSAGHDVLD